MDESAQRSTLGDRLITLLDELKFRSVQKPWGYEHVLETPEVLLKIIHVRAGQRTSLQYHERKREVLFLTNGTGTVLGTVDDDMGRPRPSWGYVIEPGSVHRAVGPLDMLEVTTPDDDDVVRVADDYSRETKLPPVEP